MVVISVSVFKDGTNEADMEAHRDLLEAIHFQKMDMADFIVLIHKDAVGQHTQLELDRCRSQQKPVYVFELPSEREVTVFGMHGTESYLRRLG